MNYLNLNNYQQRRVNLLTGESSHGEGLYEPINVSQNNFEEIDDDVIETSPRAFAEAVANARRNRMVNEVDSNRENHRISDFFLPDGRILQPNDDMIYINFDFIAHELAEKEKEATEAKKKAFETPKESPYKCPICMDSIEEEMATRCGHIFCKFCIKKAIKAQGKCPACREPVTSRQLRRVFLPSPN
ncbi:hypothetical protein RYX36_021716 [Vicia faba]